MHVLPPLSFKVNINSGDARRACLPKMEVALVSFLSKCIHKSRYVRFVRSCHPFVIYLNALVLLLYLHAMYNLGPPVTFFLYSTAFTLHSQDQDIACMSLCSVQKRHYQLLCPALFCFLKK